MSTEKALRLVADPTSPYADFDAALQYLDSLVEDPTFWLKIAADEHYNADHRRRCVRHFFDRYVSPRMSLDELLKTTGVPVNWISCERIAKITDITGWIPKAVLAGNCRFAIPILPKQDGSYRLVVFLAFEQDVALDDLVHAFQSKPRPDHTAVISIAGCAAWDTTDQARKYPGAPANSWTW